ncbi:F-box and associated interaction domains-containing protein putative isoform 1 [Tripterygium wilfordii]|uniref:F-box and associated interaction domains-containing protein putative isoform 1 n=1 Tax=Tripterygium wilfordii TaxID=458696 RepID=A0A7J7CGH2_TRIWF|nr:F-box and associated interaction domains-containing protein putative isoform 1 [Tripterygium wilfordii]
MAPKKLRHIPDDLVLDILTTLPVKALKRFRCVCKAWCDLFGNTDFIHAHCIKQTTLEKERFFVNHYDKTDDECNSVISIFESDCDEVLNFTETIRIPFNEVFLNDPFIIGFCNGIVCVSDDVKNIGFWNPATREYKPLPPLIPSIEPPDDVDWNMHSNNSSCSSLNFTTITVENWQCPSRKAKNVQMGLLVTNYGETKMVLWAEGGERPNRTN